jgi:predicted NUDIX family NTP pyrophosphohydrolase
MTGDGFFWHGLQLDIPVDPWNISPEWKKMHNESDMTSFTEMYRCAWFCLKNCEMVLSKSV